MLIIKAESTSVNIKEMVQEAHNFAKKHDCAVELNINDKDVLVAPYDSVFEILEQYKNGYYD